MSEPKKNPGKPSPLAGIGSVVPAILLLLVVLGVGFAGKKYLENLKPAEAKPTETPEFQQGGFTDSDLETMGFGFGDVTLYQGSIELNEKNELRFDDELVKLEDFAQKIEQWKIEAGDAKPMMIISAHDDAKARTLADIIDILKKSGIENITLSGFTKE